MVEFLKPDYSILKELDIYRDYSREELVNLYNHIHHLDDPEQVAEIKRRARTSAWGSPFEPLKLNREPTSSELFEMKSIANINAIDKDHAKMTVMYQTGKIPMNELNKQIFISWLNNKITKLREEGESKWK